MSQALKLLARLDTQEPPAVSLGKLKTTSASQAVTWPAHLPPENPSHPPPETDSKQGLVAACLESHCLSYFRAKHLEELNTVARLQV